MPKDPKLHCPICDRDFLVGTPEGGSIEDYVGFTVDCPLCLGLLKINSDLTCSDFVRELRERSGKRGCNLEGETIGRISI